jgi:signal transduction histidine kinase
MPEDLAPPAALAVENTSLLEDAQRALRAREAVLAVVTHELRTPLSAVMAAASLLISEALNADAERVRQRAQAIQRAAAHMSRLVADLTDLAQIDAGRLAIGKKREDPAALIRQAVETLEPLIQLRGGTLQCVIGESLGAVACDRDRIVQVICNLVGNASKVGAQTISIGAMANSGELRVWVGDDGPGIPSEDLPHMFDRYFRGRNAPYKGSGLGLPIAKGIVEGHGGRMWIESSPGVGTTFFFTLPR